MKTKYKDLMLAYNDIVSTTNSTQPSFPRSQEQCAQSELIFESVHLRECAKKGVDMMELGEDSARQRVFCPTRSELETFP